MSMLQKGFSSNKGNELLRYQTYVNVKLPLNECMDRMRSSLSWYQIKMRHQMLWGFKISLLTTWYLRIENFQVHLGGLEIAMKKSLILFMMIKEFKA